MSATSAIALVGGGPRGVSLLERVVSALAERADPDATRIDVYLIDDVEVGAGRVWRTDQTRELCMNTLADAVTLFTDESVHMAGTVRPGPTLYEWAILAAHAEAPDDRTAEIVAVIPPPRRAGFAEAPVRAGFVSDYAGELGALRPESHPSRSLYGEYIAWALARVIRVAPDGVRVHTRTGRVRAIVERGGRQELQITDAEGGATEITVDAVVLATGWLANLPTAEERQLSASVSARPELVWVAPGNPVDQDLSRVPAGEDVIIRGLGMGFFDTVTLLTLGRGGRFVMDAGAAGGLRYEASGAEPILWATSPRGVPYRAKTLYGSLPPRAPQRHLRAVLDAGVSRPIDVEGLLWPAIRKDAFEAYYETLHRTRPGALTGSWDQLRAAIAADAGDAESLAVAVAPYVANSSDLFDLSAALDPSRRSFANREEFDTWVAEFLADDLREAERGADSPLKAALWSIGSARQPVSLAGAFGGFDAATRRGAFGRLLSIGGMFGSGPPAFRNRQLLALHTAGIVRFLGPRPALTITDDGFRVTSGQIPDAEITARILIDAWMHMHDAGASADPLVRSLTDAGRLRVFQVAGRDGQLGATGGIDIDPATGLLVRGDGTLDPAVHVAGIPVDEVVHDTIISPMPGTNPTMLRETDRVARSAVRIALHAASVSPTVPLARSSA